MIEVDIVYLCEKFDLCFVSFVLFIVNQNGVKVGK